MNKNNTYIITDIHPQDAYYRDSKKLVGTKLTKIKELRKSVWKDGYLAVRGTDFEGDEVFFMAVKISPKKSFWQKLEDICMELFG